MQSKTRNLDLAIENQTIETLLEPVLLDLAVLDQVAGGSPKGTWAPEASIIDEGDSPKGTW